MENEATRIARRSDSLYYDSVSRRQLCDMIARLEAGVGEHTCYKLPATNGLSCVVTDERHGITQEFGYWECSECGCNCFEGAKYCMGCGRRAVSR